MYCLFCLLFTLLLTEGDFELERLGVLCTGGVVFINIELILICFFYPKYTVLETFLSILNLFELIK